MSLEMIIFSVLFIIMIIAVIIIVNMKIMSYSNRNDKCIYEYRVLSAHPDYVNDRLTDAKEEGWEVAGSPDVKYHGSPTFAAFMYFPLRRELKQ